jgi:hypothetical protein
MNAPNIITRYWAKPIRDRQFDWCAYVDGEEERGHYGYGRTKEEAIIDLARLFAERAEAAEEQFYEKQRLFDEMAESEGDR